MTETVELGGIFIYFVQLIINLSINISTLCNDALGQYSTHYEYSFCHIFFEILTPFTVCPTETRWTFTSILIDAIYTGSSILARVTITLINSWKTNKLFLVYGKSYKLLYKKKPCIPWPLHVVCACFDNRQLVVCNVLQHRWNNMPVRFIFKWCEQLN